MQESTQKGGIILINHASVKKILYGGDYNPEQWPEEVLDEDMVLFKKAHIDVVTLNVFNWAMLQPSENTYDFSRLDREMERLRKEGMKVCLATSTAAHPAWMAKRYPEILRTEYSGLKRKFGGRHNSCPNSEIYRKYSVRLAMKLAERYKDYDHIVAWHISNEYGGRCYCENCEKAFRVWLQDKYGTIENLNRAWNTSFWSHTFYDWDEIVLPNAVSEHFGNERTMFQGISLDYMRFNSDSMMTCYKLEYEAIKEITPNIPITTNLMGFYKELDYHKWAKYMDFVSWDNYPSNQDEYYKMGRDHDLMRGLKDGMPFALMEQTPSVTNWQPYNNLKRPGVMRLWSYQAVAHGSDTVMFFQMRRSIGACEKYHGAVIDHVGSSETRVFRECSVLGAELERLGDEIIGSTITSKVAIIFDWDNWWATSYSAGPTCQLDYCKELTKYYDALAKKHINIDVIGVDTDLTQYDLVIAPVLYMVKGDFDKKLKDYVSQGGRFLTTFFSGYVDEHDLVTIGGYPGKLRDLMGVWVEESDALPENEINQVEMNGKTYAASMICDLMHLETAKEKGKYLTDFYAGMPAVTENEYGKGKAYYVGISSEEETFFDDLLGEILEEVKVTPILEVAQGVEVTRRIKGEVSYTFVLNHTAEEQKVILDQAYTDLLTDTAYEAEHTLVLAAKGVAILKGIQ